jgi:hypothetical protein
MNHMTNLALAHEPQPGVPGLDQRARRREKNMTDAIMIAFHSACDLKDLPIAWRLLQTLENALSLNKTDPSFDHRRALAVLVAGHERLWNLRNA